MSVNIIDIIKTYMPQDLIAKASSFLSESEDSISLALSGFIPTITGGVAAKATQSEAEAQQLMDIAKDANNSALTEHADASLENANLMSKGTAWFNKIFDGQANTIADAVSSFSGVKPSSSNVLIGILTPLIMGVLGKEAVERDLSASGFSGFLNDQKGHIMKAMPASLGAIGSTLGLGSLGDAARETIEPTDAEPLISVEKPNGGLKWLLPLVLLAALAFLLWWVMGKGCNPGEGVTGADTVATAPLDSMVTTTSAVVAGAFDSVSGNYIYDVGENTEIKLADGTTLKVGANSTEAKLYNMLNDASFTVDTANKSANWVVLDRVYFETGKSVLTAESQAQVKNLAAILKNFPAAAIKLGGYTDNTGDAAINKKLSGERAKIVSKELIAAGAAAKQIVEAEGYGQEFPVCEANDTPECKAQNRRVDLKVAAK